MNNRFIELVKDLEDTRDDYKGYSYIRTMRNILIGNENATIAPFFASKPYYGMYERLKLEDLELIMDALVKAHQLEVVFTEHGKLYCTKEFYIDRLCKRV